MIKEKRKEPKLIIRENKLLFQEIKTEYIKNKYSKNKKISNDYNDISENRVKFINNNSMSKKLYNGYLRWNNLALFYIIIIKYLIINHLFQYSLNIELHNSNITIKIKNIGRAKIYDSNTPFNIFINGIQQPYASSYYNFNQTDNTIKLFWKYDLTYTISMFAECSDITEIDLSNLDASKIIDMHNMFSGCTSLISITFPSNFDTSKVTNMEKMFRSCISLTSINLSHLNTSSVKTMEDMFYNCSSLTVLDLSNFDTSQVTIFSGMFEYCSNLTSINLSSFKTTRCWGMTALFYGCSSLSSLDISNFDTRNVNTMNSMFSGCSSLIQIYLSNFDTSEVSDTWGMFSGCSSLISLNITNFKMSAIEDMIAMFSGCSSLTSLDLSNFETNKKPHMDGMFRNCKNLEYLNLKKLRFSDPNNCPSQGDIFENVPDNIVINMYYYPECFRNQLPKVKCYKIDISEDWELNRYKVNALNGSCMNNCIGDFEFESYGKCYSNCTNGYYINNTKKICKCELEHCYLCPPVAFQKGLCSLCSEGYYPKENDPLNIGEYFKCYKDPIGYYLDTNDNIYKKVINRTENSEIKDLNTYLDSSYIISDNTNFCDTNHPFENILIGECVKYCSINNIINKICILKYKIDETQDYIKEYTKVQDILLENIDIGIISNEFDTSILEKGEDHLIQTEKMIIRLTTTDNQKNNLNNNITTINLGEECESLLRSTYNITGKLYLKKIDVIQDKMKIPKIEYDIYAKLNGTTLTKLKKSICKQLKITLNMPIEISENLDKLNTSSF